MRKAKTTVDSTVPAHSHANGKHYRRGLAFACGLWLAACATDGTRPPALVTDGAFIYPPTAKAQHIEGEVIVEYTIDAAGGVAQARVIRAVPAGVFDQAALDYVRHRQYRGDPQRPPFVARTTVNFKLGESYPGL